MVRKPSRALWYVRALGLLIAVALFATACESGANLLSPAPATTQGSSEAGVAGESSPAEPTSGSTSSTQSEIGPRKHIKFERISLEQGLSQSVVLCILQDSKGFMWFGTQDGLNRYDGYEFVVYKHDPADPDSLSDNFIQSIYEDPSGALWVGTNTGGLDRFDRYTERFTHYRSSPDDPHGLSNNGVLSIHQDREGALWIGTNGGGLDRFDPQTERFTHYQNDPADSYSLSSNVVLSVFEDRHGILWVGTTGGLDRFDPQTGQFTHYQNDPGDPHSLSNNVVQSICEDREGMLWVGTNGGGLDRFDPQTERFTHYQHDPDDPNSLSSSDNNVQAIYEDQAGTLWVGTGDSGLNRFDRETEQFLHYQNDPSNLHSLSSDTVQSIHEGQAGILWIGTFGAGLCKFDRDTEQFALYQNNPNDPNSLSRDMIWSFAQDQEDALWIGTNGGGLNRLDRETGEFTHYRNDLADPSSLSDDVVWSVYRDRENVLWAGTSGALDRFDRETEQFTHYPVPLVTSIHHDQENTLWVGTLGAGLGRFDRETDQFAFYVNDPSDPQSLTDNTIIQVFEDRDGALWIGTFNGGLDRFNRQTENFAHYRSDPFNPYSLTSNTVLTIHQDREGRLWIGTTGGLNRFSPAAGTFIHYRERDGLPNDVIYGILEDEQGFLWLSTNAGLSKFDPETETFRNFDEEDGLQSNEFNMSAYYESDDGEMFFGGVNGFNAFYPGDVRDNPDIPVIVITDFQLFNQSVAVGGDSPLQKPIEETGEIELSYQDDFFSFEFAALHYSSPEENQYAYIMEGLDKDWNDVGTRRFAGYTSVPPGRYTFRVKGSNSDGVWNEEGTSISIIITPPFWQTWWFRALAALFVIGGVFGVFALRIRSVEVRRRQLEIQVGERTKELRETLAELERSKEAAEAANRAKSVFLANMSHEFRTPLNAVLGFTQLMLRDSSIAAGERENLEIVHRSGEHLLGLINEVLEMSKIEAGRAELNEYGFDLYHLLAGLEEMFRLRAEDKELELTFDRASDVPQYVRADEGKLRQVLMNLLGNAVKFTQEGSVILRVTSREHETLDEDGTPVPLLLTSYSLLQFEIEDTGPGIAPDELVVVFDPFVQTATGQESQEGTGLGLSISQQFARLMGGEITVSSQLGQGSVFKFEIPVEIVDANAVQMARPTRLVIGLEPGQPVYRLLIVDDKEVNRKLLVKLLTPLGFELREAANGQEAVEIWEQWEPHLIWMDMRMPVMDGYEATRQIKATTKGQATVIVAVTASALEEDRAVILSEGCDAYIRKPFREDDLFSALVKHLGVRFVYHEAEGQDDQPRLPEGAARDAQTLSARDPALAREVATLPADWISSLREATILGDLDRILALIDQIRGQNADLAAALVDWARNFKHDRILTLIQQAAGGQDEQSAN